MQAKLPFVWKSSWYSKGKITKKITWQLLILFFDSIAMRYRMPIKCFGDGLNYRVKFLLDTVKLQFHHHHMVCWNSHLPSMGLVEFHLFCVCEILIIIILLGMGITGDGLFFETVRCPSSKMNYTQSQFYRLSRLPLLFLKNDFCKKL